MEIIDARLEAIADFLCGMKFKTKLIGGIEEEDVLNKIEHITKLYQDLVEVVQDQNACLLQENSFLKNRLKQHQQELQKKDERLSSLQEEKTSIQQEYKVSHTKAQELIDMIRRQEKEREELVIKAQREAQRILAHAKIQAENFTVQKNRELQQQMQVRQLEIEQLLKRRKTIEDEINSQICKTKSSLQLVTEDLYQMLNLAKDLDRKMNQYRNHES